MKQLLLIRKSVGAALLAAVLVIGTTASSDTSKISSLRIEPHSGSSSYVISKSGTVELQEFLMEEPPRLVLDLLGTQHALDKNKFDGDGKFVRSVRTSQFTTDPEQITRIVFDLHDNVRYSVKNEADAITVRFSGKDAPKPMDKPATMAGSVPSNVGTPKAGTPNKPKPAGKTAATTSGSNAKTTSKSATKPMTTPKTQTTSKSSQKSTSSAKPKSQSQVMKHFAQWSSSAKPKNQSSQSQPVTTNSAQPKSTDTKPFPMWQKPSQPPAGTGTSATIPRKGSFQTFATQSGMARNKSMTIDVQNAHVRTVLSSLAEFSGTNIIAGPEVEGKITAHLKNVPWRQALDIILKSHGFGWREEYGVIRVSTLDRLNKEELELQAAERQKDELMPLVTQIMALSYANAGEMKNALKEILTTRGSIEIEKSNNALIVTDIQKRVDKIAAMVNELDRKTRQVEIVAKMVDVDFEASREIGIRWDALNLSVPDINGVGDAVINARSTDPVGSFRVGTVQSWGDLQAIIDALERRQKANIISNPRIVTADNREASLLVGKEIPLIVSDEAGNPITELTKVGIILRVTPHVNQDNSVTLDLHPEVSELSAQATVQGGVIISLSEADTRVVVAHGETAVIGGLINEVESTLEKGVPGLMRLPFIGRLFKLDSKTTKKRELIIFVTPKIVDQVVSN